MTWTSRSVSADNAYRPFPNVVDRPDGRNVLGCPGNVTYISLWACHKLLRRAAQPGSSTKGAHDGHTESHAAVASITQALRVHWRRWLIPAALTTVLCTCYATVIYQPPWEVTQALTVRDEAASGTVRPGSFDTPETLKNYQETILELITSPTVVSAALQQVGPPSGSHGGDQWPTPIDIDKARGNIRIVPPNGTELGTTELFYLKVEDTDRQPALKFTVGGCQQLERRFQQLRNRKTQSVIDELSQTVELAKAKLDTSVDKLSQIEQSVGVDLVELRTQRSCLRDREPADDHCGTASGTAPCRRKARDRSAPARTADGAARGS